MTKRERVLALLRSYHEAAQTVHRDELGRATSAPGSRLLTLSAAWHEGCPSANGLPVCTSTTCVSPYRELEERLRELRGLGRHHYAHLIQRYVDSERVSREVLIGRDVAPVGLSATEKLIESSAFAIGCAWCGRAVDSRPHLAVGLHTCGKGRGRPPRIVCYGLVERWKWDDGCGVQARMAERGLDFLVARFSSAPRLPGELLAA